MNTPQSVFLLSAIIATAAFVVSWAGYFQCQFVKFPVSGSTSRPISLGFGLWYRQTFDLVTTDTEALLYSSCGAYDDGVDIDASWKAARAFAVLALISGLVSLLTNIVACCYRPDPSKAVIGPAYALTTLLAGLSLLFLNGNACDNNEMVHQMNHNASSPLKDIQWEESCKLATGANCIIAATVLYFAASIFSCVARAEEKKDGVERPEGGQFGGSLGDPFLEREPSIFLR